MAVDLIQLHTKNIIIPIHHVECIPGIGIRHNMRSQAIYWVVYQYHWGRVTQRCGNKLTIIGSDIGLSPDLRQTIIYTKAGILLIRPFGTDLNRNSCIFIQKMHLKMSSGKWRPFCLGLNVLIHWGPVTHICVCNLTIIGSDNRIIACRLVGVKPLPKRMLEYC